MSGDANSGNSGDLLKSEKFTPLINPLKKELQDLLMESEVIQSKLESLSRCIACIEQ
jgi:hypothetical protein